MPDSPVEPCPTRAEVGDTAHAMTEGADAIMLAGETAIGAFPVRAVQTLDAIIRDAESAPPPPDVALAADPTGSRHGRALCEAAVTLATAGGADAIVAVTREGKTARLLSALRPLAPIVAATPDQSVAAHLAIYRGVHAFVSPDAEIANLQQQLVRRGLIRDGAVVVFVNVSPELSRVDANFLTVQRASL